MMATDIRQDLAKITIPVLVLGSKYETLEKSQQIDLLYKCISKLNSYFYLGKRQLAKIDRSINEVIFELQELERQFGN